MKTVRTRFAPSPTGKMHVGNLRTALYAYLVAKHEGGDFILRIEDTDQERFVEGAIEIINRTLQETGLIHDEGPDKDGGVGPYVQSERQKQGIYLQYAKQLVEKGEAYYCFCTKERLAGLSSKVGDNAEGKEIVQYDKHCLHLTKEEVEENLAKGLPYVIRQNNPTEGTTTFHDIIYGDITVDNSELDDMILIKSDGYPTYNFANVVDDHLMGITHVVRGNEYLSSSPKYNRLYEAFGWEVPEYIHCPLITDETHKKLSKRCGHSSFEDLLEQGFLREAIVNFVALLGWSPEEDREIFSLEELVQAFDYHRINKAPAVFDMVKLLDVSKNVISKFTAEKIYEEALKWAKRYDEELVKMLTEDKEYAMKILNIERGGNKPRKDISKWAEIKHSIEYMYDEVFDKNTEYEFQNITDKEEIKEILSSYLTKHFDINDDKQTWFDKMKDLAEERGYAREVKEYKANPENYKGHVGDISTVIRVALTGRHNTPDLYEIMQILGKDRIEKRINKICGGN